jgi:hypothetical protein
MSYYKVHMNMVSGRCDTKDETDNYHDGWISFHSVYKGMVFHLNVCLGVQQVYFSV